MNRCGTVRNSATAARGDADRRAAKGDYRDANAALDAGLRTLGTAYQRKEAIDDTGMHLGLAAANERRGRSKQVFRQKRRVLTERLRLCTGG